MSKNYKGRLKQQPQNRGYNPEPAERQADFANTGGAWETRADPSTTQPRNTAGSPLPTVQDQKMVKRDRHAHRRTKTPLARASHAPNSNNQRDLCNRQQERTATEIPANGRVSSGNQRASIDLASNISKKQ